MKRGMNWGDVAGTIRGDTNDAEDSDDGQNEIPGKDDEET